MPAPAADALLRWPDAFGSRFAVFVDTEEEFDWGRPFSREARATTHVRALPEAHAWFAGRGVPLTYLADHPVATCPRAVETLLALLQDGRSAIGTQLHPWVNPPFKETVNGYNSFAGNLAVELEAAKLRTLTDTITHAFGVRPRIYRAGRYGFGPNCAGILSGLGYRIDSSMRSGYDYSGEGGADFTQVGNQPFRLAPGLTELPLTTVYTGRLRRGGARLYQRLGTLHRGRGIASRLGLLSRVALTPEDMPVAEALEAIRTAAGEGLRFLHFSFHSPSLEPGHTPYVRDAADLKRFYRWWGEVLSALDRIGVRPASLSEIIEALDMACDPRGISAIAHGAGGL
ncbi:polysaccharide deacetylase family protein [Sphingomonas xinjiangensis]|uniref:WalW protein n=1 Tax=Sphingomonas xinjiangensis TaxID=643568 RepID=A0A840YK38_9SPHN|nr:hypothetical protein [Sphingomonas xinjiangensis]